MPQRIMFLEGLLTVYMLLLLYIEVKCALKKPAELTKTFHRNIVVIGIKCCLEHCGPCRRLMCWADCIKAITIIRTIIMTVSCMKLDNFTILILWVMFHRMHSLSNPVLKWDCISYIYCISCPLWERLVLKDCLLSCFLAFVVRSLLRSF